MRMLIATLDDLSLFQTGHTTLWAGTPLETVVPSGIIVGDGDDIDVPNIDSLLMKGFWTVVDDPIQVVEKGRPRQFSSRSEAGRYAAQIRWGNRNATAPKPPSGGSSEALTPTDDPSEAVLTGRPLAGLQVENFPPHVQMMLKAVEHANRAGVAVDSMDKEAHEQLVDHLMKVTDPKLLSPEALAAVNAVKPNKEIGYADWVAHHQMFGAQAESPSGVVYRRQWAESTADWFVMAARERGVADRQEGALRGTKDVVAAPDKMRLAITVRGGTLRDIETAGGLTTQFAGTNISSGMHNLKTRSVHEAVSYGVHPAAAPNMRPIYGTISPLGIRHAAADGTDQYGSIHLVLKRSVADRATFSVHDSLGMNRNPSPVKGPITRPQASPHRMGKDIFAPEQRLQRIRNGQNADYAEAQIHGGVKLSDISHIVVSLPHTGGQVPKVVEGFARRNGLQIKTVLAPPAGNKGKGYGVVDDSTLQKMFDAMEKGRPRQFSSRSEAGRYAAQVRWGNRNAGTTSGAETYAGEKADMEMLQTRIADAQAKVAGIGEGDLLVRDLDRVGPEWEADTEFVGMYKVKGELVPSQRLAAATDAVNSVGSMALSVANKRLKAQGVTKESAKAHQDELRQEYANTHSEYLKASDASKAARMKAMGETDPKKKAVLNAEADKLSAATDKLLDRKVQIHVEIEQASYTARQNIEITNVMQGLGVLGGKVQMANHVDKRVNLTAGNIQDARQGIKETGAQIATVVPKSVIDHVSSDQPKLAVTIGPIGNAAGAYAAQVQEIVVPDMGTLTTQGKFRVVGHEYGHAIENSFPQVKPLQAAFTQRRIRMESDEVKAAHVAQPKGDATFWSRPVARRADVGGLSKEDPYIDSFGNPYAGSHYRYRAPVSGRDLRDRATKAFPTGEVFSSGVESLTRKGTPDSADNDHRRWTLGMLLSLTAPATKAVDAMDKAERRFGSRSEAGRYAAQVRWGNRGGDATAQTAPTAPTSATTSPTDLKNLEPDTNAATQQVTELYTPAVIDSFTPDERDAALGYAASGKYFNEGLRNGELDDEDWDTVNSLDAAIAKAPPLKKPMLVYRGLDKKTDPEVIENLKGLRVGQSFSDDAYCSTTIIKGTAQRFTGKVMLEIALPAGHKALSLRKLGTSKLGFGESELLLERETRMKVLGKSKTEDGVTILRVTPTEAGTR